MEELLYVRRINGRFRRTNGPFRRNPPTLKLEINDNRFILSEKAQENTKLKNDDGVMFGFNYKQKKAYMFKDDEPDAFLLRAKSVKYNGLRFTSKDLANHFIDCFNIDMDKSTYFFSVADKPNEKGAFLIELN